MTREEIENRIIVCEHKAIGYREVGNTRLADKYDNEKYKQEKLLSDLALLNERKITELLDYKKGYFNLEQENKELHNKIDEISNFIKENKIKRYRPIEGEEYDEEILLDEDDITCLERIINDEYDYENR